ncbi:hypothetical protein BOTBODRAFT_106006 [Botryobasidium botryosum FD-172 SS1]|uniref:LAA1-like C-terminal TPR repeats domain-containing protein n=1 Tax=Botryobasidium botryosum (strain FD-172 SS1) TaxID=930990 RepID=A0A067N0H5_BOTB1|nr:hypothetical protein BOTBODRAFT_106006 [Botryobasidium botryosum FD-172 SS1]
MHRCNSTQDVLKSSQSQLEATLLKAITSVAPFPPPGRPIRNLVARCYISLFTRGETKSVFDVIQALLKVAGDPKSTDKDAKAASFYCLGEIMEGFGSQALSFMGEIVNCSIKVFRTTSNVRRSVLLRCQALSALRKSLQTGARAIQDYAARDMFKHMKNGLSDKALPIQRAVADVLLAMHVHLEAIRSLPDVEAILALCVKALDSADHPTRHTLSVLVGNVLASTQTPRAPIDTSKKTKKTATEEDDTAGSIATAAGDAPVTLLTPAEMLNHLAAPFNRINSSRQTRIGIIEIYSTLFTVLGSNFVETNYSLIVRHFTSDIVSHTRNTTSRYETLFVRKLVGTILRDLIGARMLSEQGQIAAIKELANSYLRKWPALLPGSSAPSEFVLAVVLRETSGLLQQLGSSPPPVQESLSDPLVQLLSHSNHSTRIGAAWCLRHFCSSTPLRLPKAVLTVLEMLQNEITAFSAPTAPSDIASRALGHTYGLAALFSVFPERPLYVAFDISAKVLDTAIQLLKHAGEHDLSMAEIEVEIAWTSIASLMTLGPNFVRTHLSQLLVLWRNALPKPTSRDATAGAGRSPTEWAFLLHVRQCALGAVLSFLKHNSPTLITLDVARRLTTLLTNALSFVNSFSTDTLESQEELANTSVSGLSLLFREAMLRRRVYQCFSSLGFSSLTEQMQSTLLQSVTTLFASADGYAGSFVQASIATSAGTVASVWQSADEYGYGVTSLDFANSLSLDERLSEEKRARFSRNRDLVEVAIEEMVSDPPVIGSCEHDPLQLCQTAEHTSNQVWPEPPPAATAVVDAAIELFSVLLPAQEPGAALKIISQLVEMVRSPKLERNSGRKSAVFINATAALLLSLRVGTTSASRQVRESFGSPQISAVLSDFLKDAILDGDATLRFAGSEALGRLASLAGTSFLTSQIKFLVDQVVNNRDPSGRAGCALAFGAIYTQVGGLAAGPLLKTTVNVLMSLGNDPHPVVHFWALNALAQVINAASLSYSPFISSTMVMLFKLYMLDTHEPEGGSISNSNLRGDLPVYQVLCQIIDAVIGVLGPELQDSTRTRTLVLDLVQQFAHETDEGICVEAIKCIQHILIFGGDFVDIPDLVRLCRTHLYSPRRPLKMASINALYQLVQRDAFAVSKLGGDTLVQELFGMLDNDPGIEGVRNVISNWLQQTAIHNPSAWIDLCQVIMSRATATQQAVDTAAKAAIQDDEAESLNFGASSDQPAGSRGGHLTSRWRTQLFALQCLHSICTIVATSGRREHLDIPFAKQQKLQTSTLLVSRVPDLIRMAFTASAAYVTEIRLQGLILLQDIIQIFAQSPDPDYDDILLLEQHQAPITAALTPAFSADSTPEILASAVEACAIFVGCGVVKDVGRMGRILKLLTTALEQSKETGTLTIGEVGDLSPNASVMLRVSILTAWAELEAASPMHAYLKAVLRPHRPALASLWIATLRDYASIRADSELTQENSSTSVDVAYAGLGREVLLPYYSSSWIKILKAIATAMDQNDTHILAAMDGTETANGAAPTARDEPTSHFFVLFGLIYEALGPTASNASPAGPNRQNAITALEALKSLVASKYSGKALLEPTVFDEFCALCYRLAMTEPPSVLLHLIPVLSAFATSGSVTTLPPQSPLTHCLRVCAYILRHAIPSSLAVGGSSEERTLLLRAGFDGFFVIGQSFGVSFREEIRAIAISLYTELLKDEHSEADLAGPTLPALKTILTYSDADPKAASIAKYTKLVHGFLSACLLHIDEMRGRQGPVATTKIKNNMLATVLVLTVLPTSVKLGRAVVDHCCYLISHELTELAEVSLTAAHCAKTLVLAALSGNPTLEHCVGQLLPGMITYVSSVAGESDKLPEYHIHGLEEILKALSTFFTSVAELHRARVLSILLPLNILLLDSDSKAGKGMQALAVSNLLQFANSAPAAFKEATSKLDQNLRSTLEASLRQALSSTATTPQPAAKPQISLRTF